MKRMASRSSFNVSSPMAFKRQLNKDQPPSGNILNVVGGRVSIDADVKSQGNYGPRSERNNPPRNGNNVNNANTVIPVGQSKIEIPVSDEPIPEPKQSVFDRMAEENPDCFEDARMSKMRVSQIRMLDKCNIIFGLFGLMLSTQTYSLEYNLQFGNKLTVLLM